MLASRICLINKYLLPIMCLAQYGYHGLKTMSCSPMVGKKGKTQTAVSWCGTTERTPDQKQYVATWKDDVQLKPSGWQSRNGTVFVQIMLTKGVLYSQHLTWTSGVHPKSKSPILASFIKLSFTREWVGGVYWYVFITLQVIVLVEWFSRKHYWFHFSRVGGEERKYIYWKLKLENYFSYEKTN